MKQAEQNTLKQVLFDEMSPGLTVHEKLGLQIKARYGIPLVFQAASYKKLNSTQEVHLIVSCFF